MHGSTTTTTTTQHPNSFPVCADPTHSVGGEAEPCHQDRSCEAEAIICQSPDAGAAAAPLSKGPVLHLAERGVVFEEAREKYWKEKCQEALPVDEALEHTANHSTAIFIPGFGHRYEE